MATHSERIILWWNGESDTPTHKMCCTRPQLNRYHKTSMPQTCMLQNGMDLYSNQGEQSRQSWVSSGKQKERNIALSKNSLFKHTWLMCGDLIVFWRRSWIWTLKILKFKLLWVTNIFVLYYIYGISRPSLLMESTDSMIVQLAKKL